MKKVTTLLLSILSVICIFVFTACGSTDGGKTDNGDNTQQGGENSDGNGAEEEIVYTRVTEEQFKEAFGLLSCWTDEEVQKYGEKLNLIIKITGSYEEDGKIVSSSNGYMEYNYLNKVVHVNSQSQEVYWWQEGDILYNYTKTDGTEIKTISDTNIEKLFYNLSAMLTNGDISLKEFEEHYLFDKDSGLYATTFEDGSTISFGFSGSRVILIRQEMDNEEIVKGKYDFNFTYDTADIKIPQNILNMPVSNN